MTDHEEITTRASTLVARYPNLGRIGSYDATYSFTRSSQSQCTDLVIEEGFQVDIAPKGGSSGRTSDVWTPSAIPEWAGTLAAEHRTAVYVYNSDFTLAPDHSFEHLAKMSESRSHCFAHTIYELTSEHAFDLEQMQELLGSFEHHMPLSHLSLAIKDDIDIDGWNNLWERLSMASVSLKLDLCSADLADCNGSNVLSAFLALGRNKMGSIRSLIIKFPTLVLDDEYLNPPSHSDPIPEWNDESDFARLEALMLIIPLSRPNVVPPVIFIRRLASHCLKSAESLACTAFASNWETMNRARHILCIC